MSHELAFRCRVTSIMEALTATVVQEICQFMGESYAALRVEMLHEQNKKETRMEKPANCLKNVSKPGEMLTVSYLVYNTHFSVWCTSIV